MSRPFIVLELSGGGAKGAFQEGAVRYLREKAGFRWDAIGGVSIGAANGAMLAMNKHDRLKTIWESISARDVYRGKINAWSIIRVLFGADSLLSNKPFRKMIEREVDFSQMQIPLTVGAVSLLTGEYLQFVIQDAPYYREYVLASTAIPVVFPPVHTDVHRYLVDGGVRNVSPIGAMLRYDPEMVVIVNCSPRGQMEPCGELNNALDIGMRSLEIAMDEIFSNDVDEFLKINRLVQEAESQGVTLHHADGRPYKAYECLVIEPDYPLGDTLDFSHDKIIERMEHGWNKAKEVVG